MASGGQLCVGAYYAGSAVIRFTNSSSLPEMWVASLTADAGTTGSVEVRPTSPQKVAAGKTVYYEILPSSNPGMVPTTVTVGTYTLTVRRTAETSEKPPAITKLNIVKLEMTPTG